MKFNNYLFAALLVVGSVVSTPALAHKVNLFAYAEQGEVYVEGYFVDGKKAQNSTVQVFSPEGELLVEGSTDDEGQYRFSVPQRTDLKIVVNAGMGHQSEYLMSADELGGGAATAEDETDTQVTAERRSDATLAQVNSAQTDAAAVSNEHLEAVVSKAVNEAIKPLVRELSASQQKASLSGIVGGVGYIIGFLGLFAYFKARQQNPPK